MFKKDRLYCLFQKVDEEKRRLVFCAKETGGISLDFLEEKSRSFNLEQFFHSEGVTAKEMALFFSELLKVTKVKKIYALNVEVYSQKIQHLKAVGNIYELFHKWAEVYPDEIREKKLREKFMKV